MIFVQFVILLAMTLIGSRMKGIGISVMGMIGLFIFVLFVNGGGIQTLN
jgi:anaerobic C4-dicarboxylate transporter DcuA